MEQTRMRIMHVVAPAGIGGLERVVHALAAGQAQQGHASMVAAVVTAEDPVRHWLEELCAAGVFVEPIVVPARSYLRERGAIDDLRRRFAADVVHTHGFRPDVVNGPVARRLRTPCVTTVHGLTSENLRTRIYEWCQQRALSRFDAVVSVSGPLARRLIRAGVSSSRVHVVPNAWWSTSPPLSRTAAREELRISGERIQLGWVGRLSWEKGPDLALEALAHLRKLPVDLSFLGDGALETTLQRRAAAAGLGDRVRFHGAVRSAARLFPAFDAWVLSSRTEGTPIALFEAMAAGVPIVATRVGGVPDVVSEREALLVSPSDPLALAAAIERTLADGEAAAARVRCARARLDSEYQAKPWIDRYTQLYRSLHSHRPAPS